MERSQASAQRAVVTGRRRRLAFVGAAVVLLGISVLLGLREPGPGPAEDGRPQQRAGGAIRTGPASAAAGAETDRSRGALRPRRRMQRHDAARVANTRGEREARQAPAVAPADARAAATAARAFLDGYLPYSYGRAQARRIQAAAIPLLRDLETSPPRVPASVARARPQVVSVRAEAATRGSDVDVVAVVDDGRRHYRIALALGDSGPRWVVTAVGGCPRVDPRRAAPRPPAARRGRRRDRTVGPAARPARGADGRAD